MFWKRLLFLIISILFIHLIINSPEINSFVIDTLDEKLESLFLRLEIQGFMETPSSKSPNDRKYMILVDAGSSGSRVMVYSWKGSDMNGDDRIADIEHGNGLSNEDWSYKEHPGISSFADAPANVSSHIRPLMEFVSKIIPKEQHEETPVYLFATAGMRLVEESKRQLVLNYACNYVQKNYSFSVHSGCRNHFRVISGELEGIFGWIAVNYLKTKFQNSFTKNKNQQIGPDGGSNSINIPHTNGFLDMGGASMQIAFEPTKEMSEKFADNLMAVRIRSIKGETKEFKIFVTTFLGFGVNEARRRYIDSLLESDEAEKGGDYMYDACMPFQLNLTDSGHYSDKVKNKSLVLSGLGTFDNCLSRQKSLLKKNKSCKDDPCLLGDIKIPLINYYNHRFVGVSEYWYTLHSIFDQAQNYSPQYLLSKARAFCSKSWNEIKKEYSSQFDEGRLSSQCFKAAWIYNVLHDGLMIPLHNMNTSEHFEAADVVNGVEISWTLGAMLLLVSSSIPETSVLARNLRSQSHNIFIGFIIISIFLCIKFNKRLPRAFLSTFISPFSKPYQALSSRNTTTESSEVPSRLTREFSSIEDGILEDEPQVLTSGNYYIRGRNY